jgi:fatty acid desaturase
VTAIAAPPPSARQQTLYATLSHDIRALGLLNRRRGYYMTRGIAALALVAGAVAAHVLIGPSWWQLAIAAVLGLALTQVAFLTHDAGHRQIFTSSRWNEWTARLLATSVVGMGYGWWATKHSRHHGAPNQVDKDTDIEPGVISWTPEQADSRRGFAAWFSAHQGWLFFPLLTLEGINLHAAGFRAIFGRAPMKRRWLEFGLIVGRLGGLLALVFLVLPPGMAAAFIGVQLAVFGVSLGATFATNHKGMPLVPKGLTVDFLRRQVLMSRNVRGGSVVDTMMGGLNYQIEHHLFPSMPRPNLRKAAPVVRDFCARHGITYTEMGVLQSYGTVIRYLNQVGLGSRDPFQCPLVRMYRPV